MRGVVPRIRYDVVAGDVVSMSGFIVACERFLVEWLANVTRSMLELSGGDDLR